MFKERDPQGDKQNEFWLVRDQLPQATASTFYRKLNETLDEVGFAQGVREIFRPAYEDSSSGGRPGIVSVIKLAPFRTSLDVGNVGG